jgi:hypothetical protein
MKKLLLLCVVISLGIMGCGSENGSTYTSGSLSVSAPVQAGDYVKATATYIPSSGPALPGQEINFQWYTVGVTTKTQTPIVPASGSTNSSGTVISQYKLPAIRSESVRVYVTAFTGGLTNTEGWQSITVVP